MVGRPCSRYEYFGEENKSPDKQRTAHSSIVQPIAYSPYRLRTIPVPALKCGPKLYQDAFKQYREKNTCFLTSVIMLVTTSHVCLRHTTPTSSSCCISRIKKPACVRR